MPLQANMASFVALIPNPLLLTRGGHCTVSVRSPSHRVKCSQEKDEPFDEVYVERPQYTSYMDSRSGKMVPASGARGRIPNPENWPEGTANRVRAAKAPEPGDESSTEPSFGKNPGSRRKNYRGPAAPAATQESSLVAEDPGATETTEVTLEEPKDTSSEFVVYQTEAAEEQDEYDLNKKLGNPHPFIDPKVKKPIEPLTSDELWWNWRKPEKGMWSRWQRQKPTVETAFLKAMAETGQVKIYGEHPTVTESSLYRARRHLYKEERLQAERHRLEQIGPMAYYSEWVEGWTRDTSREAVQKHFEETGEDETLQLLDMFSHQTDREYRIMMGNDTRIKRDPLAMRMREDQIKQVWGGDPVYPTVNYIQDPNGVTDFRGADFYEAFGSLESTLTEEGRMLTREEFEELLAKDVDESEMEEEDEAMAQAIDIGEIDDEEETSDVDNNETGKPKENLKKDSMSLEGAVGDSENQTDFLIDFEEDE